MASGSFGLGAFTTDFALFYLFVGVLSYALRFASSRFSYLWVRADF